MLPYLPALKLLRSRRAAAALLLGLALPLACDGGEPPPEPTMTFAEYVDAYEEAQCEWRVRCKLDDSVEKCRGWSFNDRVDSYTSAALTAGTIIYHGELAQGCLDEIAALTCDREDPGATPTCPDVFEGRVAPEEPCMLAAECALEAVCGKDPNCIDMCCVGECRVLPEPIAVGEDCTNTVRECEAGAFCKIDEVTFQRTVCAPKLEIGGFCGGGFVECVDEAFCSFSTGLCTARRPAGSSCDDEWNSCMAPAECEYFGFTSICYAPAELGAPCEPEAYNRACKDWSTACNPVTRICELAADIGQSCAQTPCIGYAYCDGYSETCLPVAGLGEACGYGGDYVSYTPCGGSLQCDNDVCTEPAFLEDACPVPGEPYEADLQDG